MARDDDGPMALMGPDDDARKAHEMLGALMAFRASATFHRAAVAGMVHKICEQRIWSKLGFPSQTAFLESMHISGGEYRELRQELGVFGEELMTRMDEAGVPRKWRRAIVHVDDKKLIEFKEAMKKEQDAEGMKDLIEAFYNKAADTEIAKRQAEENLKNAKASLDQERAEKKETEKKLRRAEEDLASALEGLPRNRAYRELYTRAFRALTNLKMHVRKEGLLADDEKLFQGNVDVLNDLITEIWSIHTEKPMIGESREKYVRRIMKEQGLNREDAEKAADVAKEDK